MRAVKISARPNDGSRRNNSTATNPLVLYSSQLLECHHPRVPTQLPGRSASDLLQNYIEKFDRMEGTRGHRDGAHMPQQQSSGSTIVAQSGKLNPNLPPELPLTKEDDRDTLELLCGTRPGNAHVSVKTRCILREAEKELGHLQPCYSVPDKLDLRTVWPSMHEHLERRWRQQIRARYEAQKLQEADAAATAKAVQGSRAELFNGQWPTSKVWQHRTSLPSETRPSALKQKTKPPGEDKDDSRDEEGTEKAADSEDETDAGSLAGEAVRTDEEVDEEDADGGRRGWGSDSGLGLSCDKQHQQQPASLPPPLPPLPPEKKLDVSKAAAPERSSNPPQVGEQSATSDHEEDTKDEEFTDQQSFDERMRSYRYVLEAHALSSQLRQRLETACASAGGPRALTAEQKGRIRERLTQLQHPEFRLPNSSVLDSPPSLHVQPHAPSQTPMQQLQEPQEASRITTERLTRLMRSARSLLAESDCRLTSCRQLCDSIQTGRRATGVEQGGQQQ